MLLREEWQKEEEDGIRKMYSGDEKIYCHFQTHSGAGVFLFVFNCEKNQCLGLLYFLKASLEEQEEQAVGQQSSFV